MTNSVNGRYFFVSTLNYPQIHWFPSVQKGFGGANSIRGYEEREVSADNGLSGSIELRTPLISNFLPSLERSDEYFNNNPLITSMGTSINVGTFIFFFVTYFLSQLKTGVCRVFLLPHQGFVSSETAQISTLKKTRGTKNKYFYAIFVTTQKLAFCRVFLLPH